MVRTRCAGIGVVLLVAAALTAGEAPAPHETLVLSGATIRTMTDAGDFVGTVVIRDGKIVALGPKVQAPAGANVINVGGCTITPGLIDAHGSLGLNPGAASESGRDASLDILDAVDPFSDDWHAAARQGVTAVYVQPAAGGNLGGSGAVLRVCGGDCADALSVRSPAGIQVSLGAAPQAPAAQNDQVAQFLRQRGFQGQLPGQAPATPPPSTTLTRYAQYEQVRGQFDAAKQYAADKPTRRELPKELLLRAIKGEIPIRIEIHTEDDVRNALKLGSEFGLKATFEHVDRVRPLPEEFRSGHAPLVIGPLLGTKPSGETRRLALDGRQFALGTFGAEPRDTASLRLHAAVSIFAGYPRERVLRALTADAADLLGIGDKLGRIAVGRAADLAVFAGDPLDASTPVRMTISQGHVTHNEPVSAVATSPSVGTSQLPAKLPASYVIKTTRLLQQSGEFAPGELHVADGKINGRDQVASVPIFDVGDAPVTPGLVAAHVSIGGELNADADAAQLRAMDGLTADDLRFRGCRDAGFLTAVAAPNALNVIGGTMEVVRASDDGFPAVGVKFVLTAAARNAERTPISLAGQVELIDARLRGEPSETNLYLPPSIRKSLFAERDRVMESVRTRRLMACFEVQTRAETEAALRLINEHKLRGALLMPRDTEELKDDVFAGGVSVAVVIARLKARDSERAVRGLVEAGMVGVPLALAGEPFEMRVSAALLANAGLPRSLARRSLLGHAAFGLPAGAGRLNTGDAADFVIWSADPLDPSAQPTAIVAKGERQTIAVGDDGATNDPRRPATATPGRTGRRGR
jgi:imidazolonepropionase-like amidohydrolase